MKILVTPALCAVAVLAAACGGASTPSSNTTITTTGNPPVPSTSPAEPSAPSTPPVVPAGQLIKVAGITLNLPRGYRADRPDVSGSVVAFGGPGGDISVAIASVSNEGFPLPTVAASRRDYVNFIGYHRTPATLANVMVDGTKWWHLSGPINSNERVEVYGTDLPEDNVSIEVEVDGPIPPAMGRRVGAEIMSTVRIRS